MGLKGTSVGILGGGVAGLTLALAAAARGARVSVFEQAVAFSDVGAGLQLSANGLRVLKALHLDPAAEIAVTRPNHLRVADLRTGIGLMASRQNGPGRGDYFQVHRADLIGWLADKAASAGVALHLNARMDEANLVARGYNYVALASGVRSVARPGPAPQFTGQVAWRAVVPASAVPHLATPDTRVFIAPGRHLVTYPLRDGTLINIVAVEDGQSWDQEGWTHWGDPNELRARFAPACPAVADLLGHVDRARRWALCTHPQVQMLSAGGVPLVGDAAQTMLPFMAQGAVMAMEDAWALASSWDSGSVSDYAKGRATRRAAVARVAVRNGRIFHARAWWWLPFHRAGMWGLGRIWPGLIEARSRWIYAYDVTADWP